MHNYLLVTEDNVMLFQGVSHFSCGGSCKPYNIWFAHDIWFAMGLPYYGSPMAQKMYLFAQLLIQGPR